MGDGFLHHYLSTKSIELSSPIQNPCPEFTIVNGQDQCLAAPGIQNLQETALGPRFTGLKLTRHQSYNFIRIT